VYSRFCFIAMACCWLERWLKSMRLISYDSAAPQIGGFNYERLRPKVAAGTVHCTTLTAIGQAVFPGIEVYALPQLGLGCIGLL